MSHLTLESPPIVEKIRKLLSLSHSTNENEAALAMERVYRLLAKHNLSLSEVQGSQRSIQKLAFQKKGRSEFYERYLRLLIADVYKVGLISETSFEKTTSGYSRQETLYFLGQPHQIEIAKYVHDFLSGLIKHQWKAYKKGLGKLPRKLLNAHKRGYWCGFAEAVHSKLKQRIEGLNAEEGLILVKDPEIAEYTKNLKSAPPLKEQTVMNESYLKGYAIGSETEVVDACQQSTQNQFLKT